MLDVGAWCQRAVREQRTVHWFHQLPQKPNDWSGGTNNNWPDLAGGGGNGPEAGKGGGDGGGGAPESSVGWEAGDEWGAPESSVGATKVHWFILGRRGGLKSNKGRWGAGSREQCGVGHWFPDKLPKKCNWLVMRGGWGGAVGVKSVIPASAVTCPTRQCMMSICSRF